jgi:hypothetical protein
MTANFQPGELRDITIKGARVHDSNDFWVTISIPGTPHDGRVDLPLVPAVTTEQTAPAEWPPQVGDLWIGRSAWGDVLLFARDLSDPDDEEYEAPRVEFAPAQRIMGGASLKPDWALRELAPLRLERRHQLADRGESR